MDSAISKGQRLIAILHEIGGLAGGAGCVTDQSYMT